jgi:hypothetical protein
MTLGGAGKTGGGRRAMNNVESRLLPAAHKGIGVNLRSTSIGIIKIAPS